ncbi:hypothetical protein LptCag_1715 [Leptospirillum ferriphilum]|uniref:Uncharacterized protein n=1 Tax=Leptospirillum ferriphilum TaxID=178606 RepID=A0A094YHC4_9BACT|nr:hypothetical protein LptCag_1715 [Leptospirillum ferriphilum]OOH73598.1 hypothetical protein BOX24_03730 [Leptospirillum ferriphilum]
MWKASGSKSSPDLRTKTPGKDLRDLPLRSRALSSGAQQDDPDPSEGRLEKTVFLWKSLLP